MNARHENGGGGSAYTFACFSRHYSGSLAGRYMVSISMPHVMRGNTFGALTAQAVCDDFGQLVLVADDGKVVLR